MSCNVVMHEERTRVLLPFTCQPICLLSVLCADGKNGTQTTLQTYALANHAKEAEAFHPVFTSGINLINTTK